jgi:iron complex outermembrane receptor protein
MGICGNALGQEVEASSGQVLDEILVTAQKRTQNVQDVPASISVFSADDLRDNGVLGSEELALVTPGLTFNSANGFAQPFIRGVGSDQVVATAEPAVGYYVDGVYFASVSAIAQELNDIERVEILKGPQGTLYGRNTTGGAINVVTRTPAPGFAAEISALAGNLGQRQVRTYVGGGGERVRASLAALSVKRDGYTDNLLTGTEFDNEDAWGVRAKLVIKPVDTLTLTLSADYSDRDDRSGQAFVPIDANPLATLLGGRVGRTPRETYHDFEPHYKLRDRGIALNATLGLSALNIVSISSYRKTDRLSGSDLDASDVPVQAVDAPQPGSSWSQELQFISDDDDQFEWIFGAFAFGSKVGFQPLNVRLPQFVPSLIAISGSQKTRAYAGFGQVGYWLTDVWKLSAGLRYNREEKSLVEASQAIPEFGLFVPLPGDKKTWTDTSPVLSLEYHRADTLLYAKFSKGFKSGTYNVLSAVEPPVDPEKITAYEVGGKHDLLGNGLRVNWAAFFYDYENLQVTTVESGQPILRNAASAESYGADLDIVVAPSDNIQASLGVAWLHARYVDFENAVVYVPNPATGGFGNVAIQRDVSGNDAIRAPELTLSAQVRLAVPTQLGSLGLTASYYYNDGFWFDPGNLFRQVSHSLVQLRANLVTLDERLTLSVFGKNLLDEEVLVGVVPSNFAILGQYAAPRTYGVEVAYKF